MATPPRESPTRPRVPWPRPFGLRASRDSASACRAAAASARSSRCGFSSVEALVEVEGSSVGGDGFEVDILGTGKGDVVEGGWCEGSADEEGLKRFRDREGECGEGGFVARSAWLV